MFCELEVDRPVKMEKAGLGSLWGLRVCVRRLSEEENQNGGGPVCFFSEEKGGGCITDGFFRFSFFFFFSQFFFPLCKLFFFPMN